MASTSSVLRSKPKTESIGTGLTAEARAEIAASLQSILGATCRLMLETQIHHWNVVGPLFHPIHVLSEAQYEDLFQAVDVLAERIRALGHPTAAPQVGTETAKVAEMSAGDLLRNLIAGHEALCREMREVAAAAEAADDIVTNDLLVARLGVHEKAIWMLRAMLVD